MYTLTGNICKNRLRDTQNRNRLLKDNVIPFTNQNVQMQTELDYKYLKEKLNQGLQNLNDKERLIYELRFEHEKSLSEIAGILQIPEGSVRSGLFYLLRKLANHLKAYKHGKEQ